MTCGLDGDFRSSRTYQPWNFMLRDFKLPGFDPGCHENGFPNLRSLNLMRRVRLGLAALQREQDVLGCGSGIRVRVTGENNYIVDPVPLVCRGKTGNCKLDCNSVDIGSG